MANAARVHAVERGAELAGRTLIAFGGGAPLHAARLAEKLGISDVLIPAAAGVGSAVGFLRAPIAFEVARSRFVRLGSFDAAAVNALFAEMEAEATRVVRLGAGAAITVRRSADMRYAGQGHEILVDLPDGPFTASSVAELRQRFEAGYRLLFNRVVPAIDVEITGYRGLSLPATSAAPSRAARPVPESVGSGSISRSRLVANFRSGDARSIMTIGDEPRSQRCKAPPSLPKTRRRPSSPRASPRRSDASGAIRRTAGRRYRRSAGGDRHRLPGDVEPPDLGGRGAGANPGAHRFRQRDA